MPEGLLLNCLNCQRSGKQQYLGRLLPSGELLVLRFHHGTTLIKSTEYKLACGCGFQYDISGTVVTQNYG